MEFALDLKFPNGDKQKMKTLPGISINPIINFKILKLSNFHHKKVVLLK